MTKPGLTDVCPWGLGIGHWAFFGHCVIGHWPLASHMSQVTAILCRGLQERPRFFSTGARNETAWVRNRRNQPPKPFRGRHASRERSTQSQVYPLIRDRPLSGGSHSSHRLQGVPCPSGSGLVFRSVPTPRLVRPFQRSPLCSYSVRGGA